MKNSAWSGSSTESVNRIIARFVMFLMLSNTNEGGEEWVLGALDSSFLEFYNGSNSSNLNLDILFRE